MLSILKGEMIKKNCDPVKSIMLAISCSEKTVRNKLNGATPVTVPEAVKIISECFQNDDFSIEYLFADVGITA